MLGYGTTYFYQDTRTAAEKCEDYTEKAQRTGDIQWRLKAEEYCAQAAPNRFQLSRFHKEQKRYFVPLLVLLAVGGGFWFLTRKKGRKR